MTPFSVGGTPLKGGRQISVTEPRRWEIARNVKKEGALKRKPRGGKERRKNSNWPK